MPEFITPEQQIQLSTWVEQRDAILLEISQLRTESQKLTEQNKSLADSNSDIIKQINENTGRLEIMNATEEERSLLVSQNLALLSKKQGELQSVISGLEKEVNILQTRKEGLTDTLKTLLETHKVVFDRSSVLDKAVDRVTRINEKSISDVNQLVESMKEKFVIMEASLTSLDNKVFKRASDLSEIVENAIGVNAQNTKDVSSLIKDLKDSLK